MVYGLDWARFVVVLDLKFFELGFLKFVEFGQVLRCEFRLYCVGPRYFVDLTKIGEQDCNGVFVFNVADRDQIDRPTAR